MVAVSYRRWSFTRDFNCKAFGVLDKRSLTRGGRPGSFDCTLEYDLSNIKTYQKNNLFHPEMILRPLNTGLLIFYSLKERKSSLTLLLTRH